MRIEKQLFKLFLFLVFLLFFQSSLPAQIFVPHKNRIDSLRKHSRQSTDKGDFKTALLKLDSALAIAKLHQTDTLLGLIYLEKTEPYIKSGDYIKAIESCHQAIELYDSLNLNNKRGQAFNQLGVVYKYNNDLGNAEKYYQKAISIIEKTNKKEGLGSALNNYGTILNSTGQYQKAEEITLKAIEVILETRDTAKAVPPYFSLAKNMDNQKRYDEALVYLEKIYEIANKYDLFYLMNGYYNGKGIVLKHKGDFNAAEKNYLEALNFAELRGFPSLSMDINKNLSILNDERGNFEKAFRYFKKSTSIKDSLLSIEKHKQIAKLQEEFEAAEKEKEIELLKKDQAINKLQIRSLFLIAFLIILILTGGVYYQRYRIKKNKEIAKIKEAKLGYELDLKNQQLTTKTLEMVRKNDFLSTLSSQLNTAQKENKIDSHTLQQIEKEINFHHQIEDDWTQFEVAFNDVHKGYIDQLKLTYPELTFNELRHCALLRLGLSIKETANLLGIAPQSIKVSRNRIKKKLKLSAETSLPNFLLTMKLLKTDR